MYSMFVVCEDSYYLSFIVGLYKIECITNFNIRQIIIPSGPHDIEMFKYLQKHVPTFRFYSFSLLDSLRDLYYTAIE